MKYYKWDWQFGTNTTRLAKVIGIALPVLTEFEKCVFEAFWIAVTFQKPMSISVMGRTVLYPHAGTVLEALRNTGCELELSTWEWQLTLRLLAQMIEWEKQYALEGIENGDSR